DAHDNISGVHDNIFAVHANIREADVTEQDAYARFFCRARGYGSGRAATDPLHSCGATLTPTPIPPAGEGLKHCRRTFSSTSPLAGEVGARSAPGEGMAP